MTIFRNQADRDLADYRRRCRREDQRIRRNLRENRTKSDNSLLASTWENEKSYLRWLFCESDFKLAATICVVAVLIGIVILILCAIRIDSCEICIKQNAAKIQEKQAIRTTDYQITVREGSRETVIIADSEDSYSEDFVKGNSFRVKDKAGTYYSFGKNENMSIKIEAIPEQKRGK